MVPVCVKKGILDPPAVIARTDLMAPIAPALDPLITANLACPIITVPPACHARIVSMDFATAASPETGSATAARVGRAQPVLNVCQGIMAKIVSPASIIVGTTDLAVAV